MQHKPDKYHFPSQPDKRGLESLREAFSETFKANPMNRW
jgi:hypothetical protein